MAELHVIEDDLGDGDEAAFLSDLDREVQAGIERRLAAEARLDAIDETEGRVGR